jgi:periplasmic divalent cation tolerance protein
MKKSTFIVIFITTNTEKEAQRIAGKLLDKKKVACVNIISKINSHFWWKGKIGSSEEVLLIAKTESKFFNDIVKIVKKIHSYEVPEIIALPIIDGNKEYLEWMSKI